MQGTAIALNTPVTLITPNAKPRLLKKRHNRPSKHEPLKGQHTSGINSCSSSKIDYAVLSAVRSKRMRGG